LLVEVGWDGFVSCLVEGIKIGGTDGFLDTVGYCNLWVPYVS
jgi:hypothetical protein